MRIKRKKSEIWFENSVTDSFNENYLWYKRNFFNMKKKIEKIFRKKRDLYRDNKWINYLTSNTNYEILIEKKTN